MLNVPLPAKKIISKTAAALILVMVLSPAGAAVASDQSDASMLREKCEAESKPLDISVKNFGTESEKGDFQKGLDMLKSAKIKMAQSKYVEAKAIYNDYLKLQSAIYKNLASLYVVRTDTVINEVTTELVDFIDDKKVDQYFKLATQNLNDAKSSISGERHKTAIDLCRNAKKFVLEAYKLAGRDVPEKYRKDLKDIAKEMF